MARTDRDWAYWIAELALDRAQPALHLVNPTLFAQLNMADIVSRTAAPLVPDMSFAALRPHLMLALGHHAADIMPWIERFPAAGQEDRPAAYAWRGLFRDLRGDDAPAFDSAVKQRDWDSFVLAYRGQLSATPREQPWVETIRQDAHRADELHTLVKAHRLTRLTPRDRSLYATFGWNDHGDMPGLGQLLEGAALVRTRRAWQAVQHRFDARDQQAIDDAAARLLASEAAAAEILFAAQTKTDAIKYDVGVADITAMFYRPGTPPPLSRILTE